MVLKMLVHLSSQSKDVVGLIIKYSDLERGANGAQKMDIILANERDKKMNVTLWEDRAHQFLDAFEVTRGVPVFAMVSGLLAKKIAEATKCYLNIDYASLNEFREAMGGVKAKSMAIRAAPANCHTVAVSAHGLRDLTVRQILDYYLLAGKKSIASAERRFSHLWMGLTALLLDAHLVDVRCVRSARVTIATAVQRTSQSLARDMQCLIPVPAANLIAREGQDNPNSEQVITLKDMVAKTWVFHVRLYPCNTNLGYEEYTVVKLSEYAPGDDDDGDQDGGDGDKVAGDGGAAVKREGTA